MEREKLNYHNKSKPKKEDYGWFTYQYNGYEYGYFYSEEDEKAYKNAIKDYNSKTKEIK